MRSTNILVLTLSPPIKPFLVADLSLRSPPLGIGDRVAAIGEGQPGLVFPCMLLNLICLEYVLWATQRACSKAISFSGQGHACGVVFADRTAQTVQPMIPKVNLLTQRYN